MRAIFFALAMLVLPVLDCPPPSSCAGGQTLVCVDAGPRSCPVCICK